MTKETDKEEPAIAVNETPSSEGSGAPRRPASPESSKPHPKSDSSEPMIQAQPKNEKHAFAFRVFKLDPTVPISKRELKARYLTMFKEGHVDRSSDDKRTKDLIPAFKIIQAMLKGDAIPDDVFDLSTYTREDGTVDSARLEKELERCVRELFGRFDALDEGFSAVSVEQKEIRSGIVRLSDNIEQLVARRKDQKEQLHQISQRIGQLEASRSASSSGSQTLSVGDEAVTAATPSRKKSKSSFNRATSYEESIASYANRLSDLQAELRTLHWASKKGRALNRFLERKPGIDAIVTNNSKSLLAGIETFLIAHDAKPWWSKWWYQLTTPVSQARQTYKELLLTQKINQVLEDEYHARCRAGEIEEGREDKPYAQDDIASQFSRFRPAAHVFYDGTLENPSLARLLKNAYDGASWFSNIRSSLKSVWSDVSKLFSARRPRAQAQHVRRNAERSKALRSTPSSSSGHNCRDTEAMIAEPANRRTPKAMPLPAKDLAKFSAVASTKKSARSDKHNKPVTLTATQRIFGVTR